MTSCCATSLLSLRCHAGGYLACARIVGWSSPGHRPRAAKPRDAPVQPRLNGMSMITPELRGSRGQQGAPGPCMPRRGHSPRTAHRPHSRVSRVSWSSEYTAAVQWCMLSHEAVLMIMGTVTFDQAEAVMSNGRVAISHAVGRRRPREAGIAIMRPVTRGEKPARDVK